jgi:ribonucleotide reductase alpha subunit
MLFSSNAMKVFNAPYARQGGDGRPLETPGDCFRRVADAVARSEARPAGRVGGQALRDDGRVPAPARARTLSNAGTGTPRVSNSVVPHTDDSLDRIPATLRGGALLQRAGTGVGVPPLRFRNPCPGYKMEFLFCRV